MRVFPSALGLAVLFLAGTASANKGLSGYSGKPYNGATVGDTCTQCHAQAGGATMTITVPTAVTAKATVDVSIVVGGGKAGTALNVAVSDGITATAGQNLSIPFSTTPGDLTSPSSVPGGSATYKFSFVAPNRNGTMKLWATGMATNLANGNSGDGTKSEIVTINISGATGTPTEEPDAGPGPGEVGTSTSSSTGGTGTTSSSGATTKKDGGKTTSSGSGDDDDDDDSSTGRRTTTSTSSGGCEVVNAPFDNGAALLGAAVAAGLVLSGRRRRSKK